MNFDGLPISSLYVVTYKGSEIWVPLDVSSPKQCIIWTGSWMKKGYGQVYSSLLKRNYCAHAYVMFLLGHPLSNYEYNWDHLCWEYSCVNPWHLEYVSSAENARRARLGRGHRTLAA